MPAPNLLKPALLKIKSIDKAATLYDADSRMPLGDRVYVAFEIMAQRANIRRQMPIFEQIGLSEQVRGWFTIKISDADDISYTPTTSDKVTQFGSWVTELYVVHIEPCGHWEDGPTMLRLFYADRRPVSKAPSHG